MMHAYRFLLFSDDDNIKRFFCPKFGKHICFSLLSEKPSSWFFSSTLRALLFLSAFRLNTNCQLNRLNSRTMRGSLDDVTLSRDRKGS